MTTATWNGAVIAYTLVVEGGQNRDAGCSYLKVSDAAAQVRGRVAFWKGVTVS